MHVGPVVLLGAALMGAPTLPPGLFVGIGEAFVLVHNAECPSDPTLLVVVDVGESKLATLLFSNPCSLVAEVSNVHQMVFRLDGDWTEGFSGAPLLASPFHRSDLTIAPYGQGTAIAFSGCIDCGFFGPLDIVFEGSVDDVFR